MKYRTFLLVCYSFLELQLSAQSVIISDDINIRTDNGYEILGRYKGNVLLFRDKLGEGEVVAFDEQMRKKWDKSIEYDERRVQVLDAIGGKDYFSIAYKGKIRSGTIVKVARFDASANMIDSMTVINYGNRFNTPLPTTIYSEDRKSILVYNFDGSDQLELTTVDVENMKVTLNKKITLTEQTNYALREGQFIINNNGEVIIIFRKENTTGLFSENAESFLIYTINNSNTNSNIVKIQEKNIEDVFFGYDNMNQQLHGAVLIGEKNKSRISQILLLQNANQDTPNQVLHKIQDETVSAIIGKKISTNKGVMDIKIQDIVFRKDGGMVLFLEEVRQFSRAAGVANTPTFINGDVGRITLDSYHEAVIVTSFNKDGTLHWEKVLIKKQFAQDNDYIYSSYGILKTPSSLRVIFNDGIKLETTTSEYVVNGNGEIERHSLFNTAQQDILLRFRDGLQIAADEVILPSEHRSHLRLVKVKY